jgi:hypothetical protein
MDSFTTLDEFAPFTAFPANSPTSAAAPRDVEEEGPRELVDEDSKVGFAGYCVVA